MSRLTALLLLFLSASPFTAPFSTTMGPSLHVLVHPILAAPDDASGALPFDEYASALTVPSLRDSTRLLLGAAPTSNPGWADLTGASGLESPDLPLRVHVRAGPVPLSPSLTAPSVLRI